MDLEAESITVHIMDGLLTYKEENMNFHILTLFPDMVLDGLHTSIIGRAVENGLISIEAIDIREYSTDKHRHVDDYPYGGGAGMVMQPMPIVTPMTTCVTESERSPG